MIPVTVVTLLSRKDRHSPPRNDFCRRNKVPTGACAETDEGEEICNPEDISVTDPAYKAPARTGDTKMSIAAFDPLSINDAPVTSPFGLPTELIAAWNPLNPGYDAEGYGRGTNSLDDHGGDLTLQLILLVVFPVAATAFLGYFSDD